MKAKITGVGHYLPNKVIDNKTLSGGYEISEEYILKRTGIKERRYVEDKTVTTSDLVCNAINDLLKNCSKSIEEIDCIIVGTLTPDYFFPSTAVCAINQLKAKKAWGFDLSAACSGFCYGLVTATAMIQQGTLRNVIVCGADKMSSTLNSFDYKTAVLFGDGAGAVLLEATEDDESVIKGNLCIVEADNLEDVYFKTPFNTTDWGQEKFELQGGKVYRSGVEFMANAIRKYLRENSLTFNDFDHIIPHQSNMNMLTDTAKRLRIDISKFKINIENVGNTGGASIPICLSQYVKNGEIKKGDRLLLASFGAGYTVSIIDLIWAY